MTNLNFFQRLLMLLFVGASMFVLQACSNDDESTPGSSDGQETLTLFKRWYLTDWGSSDLDWQSNYVVDHGEYMEFTKGTLYWNSRLGGQNSTYKLSETIIGGVGSSFYVTNVNNTRLFTIKKMTEKYLMIYDYYEDMYRAFVASSYAKFGSNGGDDNSDDDDDDDDDDDEGEWRDCYACNGSGVCPTCDGDGKGALIYGTDKYEDCSACRGSGQCSKCDGSGQYWRD